MSNHNPKEKFFQQPSSGSNQQHFAMAPQAEIERSTFDRSSALKTAFNSGKLIPIFVDEVLPGDTFSLHSTGFVRLSPTVTPPIDNLYIDIHYFFVPNRLTWRHWQNFMGERDYPDQNPDQFSVPQILINTNRASFLETNGQYFGLPMTMGDATLSVS